MMPHEASYFSMRILKCEALTILRHFEDPNLTPILKSARWPRAGLNVKYGPRLFTTVAVRPLGFKRHCNGRLYSCTGCDYITQFQPIDKGQGVPVPHRRLGPTPSPRTRTLRDATSTAQLTIIDPGLSHSSALTERESEFPLTLRSARGDSRGLA